MKKYFFIFFIFANVIEGSAQFAFLNEANIGGVQLVPCGKYDTLSIDIKAITTQSNTFVETKLPSNAVFMGLVNGGSLTFFNLDSFRVNLGNMSANQITTIRFLVSINCSGSANPSFNVRYRALSSSVTNLYTGQSYASCIYSPVLQFNAIDIDSSGLVLGGIHTRKYLITNSSTSNISYFDTIFWKSKYKAGETLVSIKIGSTIYTPTISGDSVFFILEGNKLDVDGKLNGGQSIVVEENVRILDQCQFNNNITDPVRIYWGCFSTSSCITPIQLNATTQVQAIVNQNVQAYFNNTISNSQVCRGNGYDTTYFKIWNPSNAGMAKIVTFRLGTGVSQYSFDSRYMLGYLVRNGVRATKNGATYNLLKDTVEVRTKDYYLTGTYKQQLINLYNNFPANGVYEMYFKLDSLMPGDTISGFMLFGQICDSSSLRDAALWEMNNGQFGYGAGAGKLNNLRSNNSCNTNLVYSYPLGSSGYTGPFSVFNYFSAINISDIAGKSNYYVGDTNILKFNVTWGSLNDVRIGSRTKYTLKITLPMGLKPSNTVVSNYKIRYNSNMAVYTTAKSVKLIGNNLNIDFYVGGILNFDKTYVEIPLYMDCSVLSGSKVDSIRAIWSINLDTACTMGCGSIPFLVPRNQLVTLHCSSSLPIGGLQFSKFTHRRWNLGLADYNNDGIADGTNIVHADSCNSYTYLYGDTMYTQQKGKVVVTASTPSGGFKKVYAVHKFIMSSALRTGTPTFGQAKSLLKIYKNSNNTTYSYSNIQPILKSFGDTLFYIYDLSKDSISGKGTIPNGYTYNDGDSISIETFFRFRKPITSQDGTSYNIQESFDIYFSQDTINRSSTYSISNPNSRYSSEIVNLNNDIFRGSHIGQIGAESSAPGSTTSTCGNLTYRNDIFISMSPRIWTRTVFFNEIRTIGSIIEATVPIPRVGVRVDSLRVLVSSYGNIYKTIPASMISYLPDSGFARLNMQQILNWYGAPSLLDEGTYVYILGFYSRYGAALYDQGALANSTNSIYRLVDYNNTAHNDLTPPVPTKWYSTGTMLNKFFLNPRIDGFANGANSKNVANSKTSFDYKIVNLTGSNAFSADTVWLYFKNNSGSLTLNSVVDLNTSVSYPIYGKYIKLGKMNAGDFKNLQLNIEFSAGCGSDSFCLYSSYSCSGSPMPRVDSLLKKYFLIDTTNFYLTKDNPLMENRISLSRTANIALCDSILVTNQINNVGSGRAYAIDFIFNSPNFGLGVDLVPNSFRLRYPANSSTSISIPAPINIGLGQFKWVDLSQYLPTLDTGGLLSFMDSIYNKLQVSFQIRLRCGFNSGLTFNTISQASCGTPSIASYSSPIKLQVENKLIGKYYTFTTDKDTIYTCGSSSNNYLKSTFTNLSSSTSNTGNDSVYIYLPLGIEYNTSVSATPRAPDNIDVLPDGRQKLTWLVSNIGVGASVLFNYGIRAVDSLSCLGSKKIVSTAFAYINDTCILDTTVCQSGIEKYRDTTSLNFYKPSFSISNVYATSTPNNSISENVSINYTILNSADISNKHIVKFVYDLNGNGVYNVGDSLLYTDTINTLIPKNTSYSGTLNHIVNTTHVCSLLLVIDSNICQCARTTTQISTPRLINAGNDTMICSDMNIQLGMSSSPSSYTYNWSPTMHLSNSNILNPIFNFKNTTTSNAAFNYILTTNRGRACISKDTINIIVYPLPTANAGIDKSRVNCNGDSVQIGSVGISGQNYNWTPSIGLDNTANSQPWAKPSTTTSYVLEVTNTTTGCKSKDTAVITVTNSTLTANAGANQRACMNAPILTLGASPTAINGTSPYTYSWTPSTNLSSPSSSNPTVSTNSSSTTNYYLQIVDNKGCISLDTVLVIIDTLPNAFAGRDTAICLNQTTNIGTSAVSGLTYLWSPASNLNVSTISNPIYTGTSTGNSSYIVTTMDNSTTCINRDTINLTVLSLPTANAGIDKSRVNCNGDSVQIGSTGISGQNYNWTPSIGLDNNTNSQPWAKPSTTTSYVLEVTNTTTGCKSKDTAVVTVTNSTLTANAGANQRACMNAPTLTLGSSPTAINGTSPYTYSWTPSTNLSSPSSSNPTVSTNSSSTTNYYLQIVDNKGCISLDTVLVIIDTLPKAFAGRDTAICLYQTTTLGTTAISGLSYSWSPASNLSVSTISNPIYTGTSTGNSSYIVTTMDNTTACINRDTINLTILSLPTSNAGIDKSRVNCNGDSVQIGSVGISGQSYNWTPSIGLDNNTNSQPWAKPSTTTSYILEVTNTTTGCKSKDTTVVTVTNSTLTANAGANQRACMNAPTLTLGSSPTAINGTSPYTYSWSPATNLSSPSSSNPTVSTNSSSTTNYYLQIVDNKGCISLDTVLVIIDTLPKAFAGRDTAICLNQTTNIGTSTVSGLTYSWLPASNLNVSTISNPIYTGTSTGNSSYIVTTMDNSTACINRDTINLTILSLPTSNAGIDKSRVNCNGDSVQIGSIGIPGQSYNWTPSIGLDNNTNSQPWAKPSTTTSYILEVTNTTTGCKSKDTTVVTVTNSTLTANAGANQRACMNVPILTLGASPTAINGTSPYTYSWSPAANLSSPSSSNPTVSTNNSSTTNYNLTVTDSLGCKATSNTTIIIKTNPTVSANSSKSSFCLGENITITATVNNGTAPYTYQWTGGEIASSFIANPTSNSNYTVTVTDANSCTGTGSVSVRMIKTSSPFNNIDFVNLCKNQYVIYKQNGFQLEEKVNNNWVPKDSIILEKNEKKYYRFIDSCGFITNDSITDTIKPNFSKLNLPSIILICEHKDTIISNSNPLLVQFEWKNGAWVLNNNIILKLGLNIIKREDSCLNYQLDSVRGVLIKPNVILMKEDSLFLCSHSFPYVLSVKAGFNSYLWNTGETNSSILITKEGWYKVMTTDACYNYSDSIYIQELKSKRAPLFANHEIKVCKSQNSVKVETNYLSNFYYWNLQRSSRNYFNADTNYKWINLNVIRVCDTLKDSVHINWLNSELSNPKFEVDSSFCSCIDPSSAIKIKLLNPNDYLEFNMNGNSSSEYFINSNRPNKFFAKNECLSKIFDIQAYLCPICAVGLPNIFSPNGDNLNDSFGFQGSKNIIIHDFSIFNKWGEKVFSTKNPNDAWDGRYKGEDAPVGVYLYTVDYEYIPQYIRKTANGSITLVR